LRLEDFNFELPEKLIAKYPCANRDESRMLVYNRSLGTIEHKAFKDIIGYFKAGDLLVRNQTKVLPARFYIKNQFGTEIEVLILKNIKDYIWTALAKPAKRLKQERTKYSIQDREIEIYRENDEIFVDFLSQENYEYIIQNLSEMPIPPYFKRGAEDIDKDRYQTVYAQEDNYGYSVAAPTAGLHFTDEIFNALIEKGVEVVDVTLHVGLGTFLPVKTENIKDHKMHSEFYSVEEAVWQKIQKAKANSKKIFAIGSTSVRTLETVALKGSLQGETDIYIYPGFEFKIVDIMLTNFHLPKSSLIMMISAFLGLDKVKHVYQEAIEYKYRFFSYGDCCLFL
jgi:S-adenosylmethionine:tRNA ribosyltransferase-isomerase